MNSFKIILMNFKHNIKKYILYIMAMAFSAAVYYNFLSMKYNPQFLKMKGAYKDIDGCFQAAAFIMIMFLIFFIAYSSNFFLNQRKKEIGVYAFMGVDNSKIGFIFATEGLLIGISSIIIGVIVGILFSKLFIMMLAKVALLDITVKFFIAKKAIINTIITFAIILFFTFLKGYIDIIRTNLIDLMNALKKQEELPKVNYFKGIASIIIIASAYYIAINYKLQSLGNAFLLAVILTTLGTYWFFGSFFSMFIRHLINKKSFLYDGVNIVSYSNIAFRIKNSYKTLAAVAILIAACITCFGTVSSMKYFVNNTHDIEVPYTLSYISNDKGTVNIADKIIKDSNHKIQLKEKTKFLHAPIKNAKYRKSVLILKLSDFNTILNDLNVKKREEILSKANLLKGEAVYVERAGQMLTLLEPLENIKIKDFNFNIKINTKVPVFGNGLPIPCLIVNDKEYESIKPMFKEYQFNGFILDKPENTKKLTNDLKKVLPKDASKTIFTYEMGGKSKYHFIGMLYFVGAFLSLVFVFATGSIIYFKTLSESFRDKSKYEVLRKVGTTNIEIYKAISKQVAIFFILPLLVGAIHSIVAISVLSKMMIYNLIVPTSISIGIFALVYGIFYIITTRKFIKIISPKSSY
ncbi:FtsX-like permease family protein [Haloimpatiens sp. FM7330]|uniref:FtsX-like permease family protein n=1 Tax=Haloimpatiens sp. FM7330 TaxID=3298610 RepID=UPI003644A41E